MRVAKILAASLLLTAGSVSVAFAQDPANDPSSAKPTNDAGDRAAPPAADTAMQSPSATNTPTQPAPEVQQAPPTANPQPAPAAADPAADTQINLRPGQTPGTEAKAPETPTANAPAASSAPTADAPSSNPPSQTAGAPAGTPPPAAAAPAAPEPPKIAADQFVLPVADYIQNSKKTLAGTDADDRQALVAFYASRAGAPLWVDKNGYTANAKSLIGGLQDADSWGLRASDYKIPDLKPEPDGSFTIGVLTAVEARLSLVAMAYARDAHGARISDPPSQLGTYVDRTPPLLDRKTVIEGLAAAPDKAAYLASLNPQHEQFRRLREKLLALRSSKKEADALKIPDGKLLKPGMSDPQIAILRKRLKVTAAPVKDDNSPADETFYDKALGDAVTAYKAKNGISPETPYITTALRRSLNAGNDVNEDRLLANMEEWRWMPADLGDYYVMVNIPEFKFRVVSNGQVIHEERIVSGRPDAQSPIFTETMKTVVIQPRWNVPDSIKIKELLPGLRAGGDPLRRQGLVAEYNGRKIDPYGVDWSRTDIRNFNIYQPPGGGNALGVVKFLFPNKHAVYLHDTPSKSLFNEPVRAFSHGCMRVRNPVTLAELVLNKDKGWDKAKVDDLIARGPEENEVNLDHPIPVHVTYFTAWVDDSGEVQTFGDVYGHENRIKLALAGKWNQIVKADEKKVSPEDIPNDNGWGNDGFASLFGDSNDDDYDDRGRHRRHGGGLGGFIKGVFGGF